MKQIWLSILVFIVFAGILVGPACKKPNSSSDNLVGITWILQSIQYPNNTVTISRTFSVLFTSDGSLSMTVDCNFCRGNFVLGAGRDISFPGDFGCTEVYCLNSHDTEFHNALKTVSNYEVSGSTMCLYFNNRQCILNFSAQ